MFCECQAEKKSRLPNLFVYDDLSQQKKQRGQKRQKPLPHNYNRVLCRDDGISGDFF